PAVNFIVFASAVGTADALPFFQALGGAQFEFTADQGALRVDGAAHAVAVECDAPAVVEAAHDFTAPGIGVDIARGHAGVADQHDFQLAAAGCAGAATDVGLTGQLEMGNGRAHGGTVYAMARLPS